MEEAIANYLVTFNGLINLITNRLDWDIRPQASSLPQIVLHKIDGNPLYSDEGESGLFSTRIQVDCWGRTYKQAKQVARQVMLRLSGQVFTHMNIEFQSVRCEDEADTFDRGAGDEDFYRTRLDFIILYKTGA